MIAQPRHSKKSVEILFEDSWYLIVNKPAGLVVIPTPHKEERTLTTLVNQQHAYPEKGRLHPCHRLDRDTSGVIVFAYGKKNQKLLMDVFQGRLVKKKYIAFVHGKMKKNSGRLEGAIVSYDSMKYHKRPKSKWALSTYTVQRLMKNFSVVEVDLMTGRTNQIRIQFSQIGHPLLGERKYAFAKDYNLKFRRTALHAHQISFRHPVTKKSIEIQAPLSDDMEKLLS
ncbi:MAG: RluA family pseudouridine synthase [Candidatus Aceula meridiana]|nr:RluA family pseudouridine synthase [Candidatus Aceula meridiana]